MDVNLFQPPNPHIDETVWHVGRPDQGSWRHHVNCFRAEREGSVAFLHDEDLTIGVLVQAQAASGRQVDQHERHASTVSFTLEFVQLLLDGHACIVPSRRGLWC